MDWLVCISTPTTHTHTLYCLLSRNLYLVYLSWPWTTSWKLLLFSTLPKSLKSYFTQKVKLSLFANPHVIPTHYTFIHLQNTEYGITNDFCPSLESPFHQNIWLKWLNPSPRSRHNFFDEQIYLGFYSHVNTDQRTNLKLVNINSDVHTSRGI